MVRPIVFLVAALLTVATSLSEVRAAPLPTMLGVNLIDLMLQYTGTAAGEIGSPGAQAAQIAAARKRLADAADQGFSVARVGVMGWGPDAPQDDSNPGANNLTLWLANPNQFWADMDLMFADLDANGIRLIPIFIWNDRQIPSITGEKVTDLLDWPLKSRALLSSFVTQFITRYKARNTILFYELFNELNLDADLDSVGYCEQSVYPNDQSRCASYANFSSSEMTAFANNFGHQVRSLDSTRKISSGYTFPRPSAWHLQQAWASGNSTDAWTADTYAEWQQYMAFIHQPFEIVSAHIYPDTKDSWFGRDPSQTPLLVDDTTTFAHQDGKLAYVGEFGDPSSSGVTPWLQSVTSIMASDRTDFATVWTWEWYQFAPYVRAIAPNYEPGYTDQANSFFQQLIGAPKPTPSVRIVVVWPQPCDTVGSGPASIGYALASSSAGIESVTFSLNGLTIGTVSAPPFQVPLPNLPPGTYSLTAVAASTVGTATSTTTFGYGQAPQGCVVPSVIPTVALNVAQTSRTMTLGQIRGTARALPATSAGQSSAIVPEQPSTPAADLPSWPPMPVSSARPIGAGAVANAPSVVPLTTTPEGSGVSVELSNVETPAGAVVRGAGFVGSVPSVKPDDISVVGTATAAASTATTSVWQSFGPESSDPSTERRASCDGSLPGGIRHHCKRVGRVLPSVRWTGTGE